MVIKKDSTDVTRFVRAADSTSGQPKTGLAYGDVTAYYVRTRGTSVSITTVSLAAPGSAHADGGWIEIDATNCKGLYRFDLPDACVADGADQVAVVLTASGALITPIELDLADDPARKMVTNKRSFDASTGIETVYDDDVTVLATGTRTEVSAGVVETEWTFV